LSTMEQNGEMVKPRKVSNRSLREAAGLMAIRLRQGGRLGCYVEGVGIACIDFQHLDQHGPTALIDAITTTIHEYLHHRHPRWDDRRVERWHEEHVRPRLPLLREFVRGLKP